MAFRSRWTGIRLSLRRRSDALPARTRYRPFANPARWRQAQPAPQLPQAPGIQLGSPLAVSLTARLATDRQIARNVKPRATLARQLAELCRFVSCRFCLVAALYPRFCTAIPPIYTELTAALAD